MNIRDLQHEAHQSAKSGSFAAELQKEAHAIAKDHGWWDEEGRPMVKNMFDSAHGGGA